LINVLKHFVAIAAYYPNKFSWKELSSSLVFFLSFYFVLKVNVIDDFQYHVEL
jgi:hypothetical protein